MQTPSKRNRESPLTNCWSLLLALWLLAPPSSRVRAVGRGELALWEDDARLNEGRPHSADSMFRGEPAGASDAQLERMLAAKRVELVAPGKELLKLMNSVSSKTRVMFLENYDRYFKEMDVGATSRPMLFAYLGLEFASQEQLAGWYGASRARVGARVVGSCRSLAELRKRSVNFEGPEWRLIEENARETARRLHLAYLVLRSNMNLFMLDNFLLLCSKLEPAKLSEEFKDLKLTI